MNRSIISEYRKFRSAGTPAAHALRDAKVVVKFRKLEAQGKVRIKANPEFEDYFSVYGEPDTKKERDEICRFIELNGIWVVSSEKTCDCCGTFKVCDSIGMCIYSDPTSPYENAYVVDLMESAIK